MYEIRLFDGGTQPLLTCEKTQEFEAMEFAKFLVQGEQSPWRAEVWSPLGEKVYEAKPPVKKT
jgi:hypothetical protein